MDADPAGRDAVAGLSRLADPVRRRLYDYVASCTEPVSRDDAAAAAGIGRTLAAYHLDKLTEAGLLQTSYARPAGRGGPGAGRPAKRYARSEEELAVSVPPRNYRLLAHLLADAAAGDDSGAVRAGIDAAARRAGQALAGGAEADVLTALRECGYEPAPAPDGGIELQNCPFHPLAGEYTELVCRLNRELVAGLLEAAGHQPEAAVLAHCPGRCCVTIRGTGFSPVPGPRSSPR